MKTKPIVSTATAMIVAAMTICLAAPAHAADGDIVAVISSAEARAGVNSPDRDSSAPNLDVRASDIAVDVGHVTYDVKFGGVATPEVDNQADLSIVRGANNAKYIVDDLDNSSTRFSAILDSAKAAAPSWDLGAGVELQSLPDGRVAVIKDGQFSSGIDAPWAVDASGKKIPTHYAVNGSVLTQVVDTTEATKFPVVADPTFHTYPFYTVIDLNHWESITAVSSVAGCAALFSKSPNPYGKAIAVGCGVFAAFGTPQVAGNRCMSIHIVGTPPALATWWPWFHNC